VRVPFDPATDYYQLLGLKPTATPNEIQAAYRRLAKTYHPDLHAGSAIAAARMARVNMAKTVLLDRDTRATYDRLRALRHPVARIAANHTAHVVRPSYRYAPPSVITRPSGPRLDRTTGVLLILVLPLLGALLLYVFEAVQLAAQPVRPVSAEYTYTGGRDRFTARGTADAVWLMVHAYPPSRSLALQANNLIISRNDQTPEGELLRAAGRHLLQAGTASDAVGWQAAVAEVCVLANRC
jgi:curved DNA-binding protein CbpA